MWKKALEGNPHIPTSMGWCTILNEPCSSDCSICLLSKYLHKLWNIVQNFKLSVTIDVSSKYTGYQLVLSSYPSKDIHLTSLIIWYFEEKVSRIAPGCILSDILCAQRTMGKMLDQQLPLLFKNVADDWEVSCNLANACFCHLGEVHGAAWFYKDAILCHAWQKSILVCWESCCSGNLALEFHLVLHSQQQY